VVATAYIALVFKILDLSGNCITITGVVPEFSKKKHPQRREGVTPFVGVHFYSNNKGGEGAPLSYCLLPPPQMSNHILVGGVDSVIWVVNIRWSYFLDFMDSSPVIGGCW